MAELSTIARPYAKAAFEYARDKGQLSQWDTELAAVAAVSRDDTMDGVRHNPDLPAEQ